MEITAIVKIYWRTIKRGTRSYSDIKDASIQEGVKALAKLDVANNIITEEQYIQFIGEIYA